MQIEHGICAPVHAPSDVVWGVLGSFGETGWYPQLKSVQLIGGEPARAGSVREIRSEDGTTIRERPGALTDHSFTCSFDGPAPFPVASARVTVTAAASGSPGATCISWQGEFEVADAAAGRTVEHINTDVVWPALAGALAARLGVTYSLGARDRSPAG